MGNASSRRALRGDRRAKHPTFSRGSTVPISEAASRSGFDCGARGIPSLFSARQPDVEGGLPAPVSPDELPQGADDAKLVGGLIDNDLVRTRLMDPETLGLDQEPETQQLD